MFVRCIYYLCNLFFMKYLYSTLITFILVSCNGYQKVLKSTDLDYKFEMAKTYYEKEDFFKALPIFDELNTLYKGTKKAEEVHYLLAYTHYGLNSNLLASYHFKLFTINFPYSKHVEELSYMAAYCFYLESPKSTLDVSNTLKAIDELQGFIDRFPESNRIQKCNELIDGLNDKLEDKSLRIAQLYYDLGDYKAAIIALNNLVNDFPAIEKLDEIHYLILDANYKLAINSVQQKKVERYNNTIASYRFFVDNFSNSKKVKDAENIYAKSIKFLENIN